MDGEGTTSVPGRESDEQRQEHHHHQQQQQQQQQHQAQPQQVSGPTEAPQSCGLGPCRPSCLQPWASVLPFTLTLAFAGFSTSLPLPIFVSQVTSIERQFQLSSTATGVLMASNEAGFVLFVLVVSHFCREAHIPRVLGACSLMFGLCSFLVAALNFVSPHSLEGLSSNPNRSLSEQDRYLCLGKNRTLRCGDAVSGTSNSNNNNNSTSGDRNRGDIHGNDMLVVVLMGTLLALQGVFKAARAPLGVSYIDDNVPSQNKTGFYIGLMLTIILFGAPFAFALGGVLNGIPVDLSDTAITVDDPRWISAWWLGFLTPGFFSALNALLFFCFPRRLRTSRIAANAGDRQKAVEQKTVPQNVQGDGGHSPLRGETRRLHLPRIRVFRSKNVSSSSVTDEERTTTDAWVHETIFSGAATPEESQCGERAGVGGLQGLTSFHADTTTTTTDIPINVVEDTNGKDSPRLGAEREAEGVVDVNTNSQEDVHERLGAAQSPNVVEENGGEMSGTGVHIRVSTLDLREMVQSLRRLARTPVFVLLVLGSAAQIFSIVGYVSFVIKFLRHQFDLDIDLGSYIFGGTFLVLNSVGTIVGGVLTSRLLTSRGKCLRYVVAVNAFALAFATTVIAFGCDPRVLVGLDSSDVTAGDSVTQCGCDVSQYLPVCDGNQTFFSPCHAGCSSADNATHFRGCNLSAKDTLSVGVCSPGCVFLVPFIVFQTLAEVLRATSFTPVYISIIRSVSPKDKTLALGVVAFVMASLGYSAGPMTFGAIVDSTCLVWSVPDACSSSGSRGACALYDVTQLRFRYIGLEVAGSSTALLLAGWAFAVFRWKVSTGRAQDEEFTTHVEKGDTGVQEETQGTGDRGRAGDETETTRL